MTPWTDTTTGPGIGSVGSLTLIDGDTFVISASSGDIRGDQAAGLFILDTRVLSVWQVEVDGAPLDAVSSVPRGPFAASIVARPHHRGGPDPELAILRHRHVGNGRREDIEIRNHSTHAIDVEIVLVFDGDLASLFEVKAADDIGTRSADLVIADDTVELVADHRIDTALSTHIGFGRRPHRIDGPRAIWGLRLSPRRTHRDLRRGECRGRRPAHTGVGLLRRTARDQRPGPSPPAVEGRHHDDHGRRSPDRVGDRSGAAGSRHPAADGRWRSAACSVRSVGRDRPGARRRVRGWW